VFRQKRPSNGKCKIFKPIKSVDSSSHHYILVKYLFRFHILVWRREEGCQWQEGSTEREIIPIRQRLWHVLDAKRGVQHHGGAVLRRMPRWLQLHYFCLVSDSCLRVEMVIALYSSFSLNNTTSVCALYYMCSGQTGTGKTHTMEGCAEDPTERGIIPRSIHRIFER